MTFLKLLEKNLKRQKNIIVELTITVNLLTIVLPGIKKTIEYLTFSSVKATLGFYYFKDIIESANNKEIECNIFPDELRIGATAITIKTTFFENDHMVYAAKRELNKNIQYANDILRVYGVTETEIQELIDRKIKL